MFWVNFNSIGPQPENVPIYLIWARQFKFQAQKFLDGPHSNPAGAADEPLHQILKKPPTNSVHSLQPADADLLTLFPNLNRWIMRTHRDAALAWLARVAQTVQTDGDLGVAAVVVFVTPAVTVLAVSTNSPHLRRHKLVAGQTFCREARGVRREIMKSFWGSLIYKN